MNTLLNPISDKNSKKHLHMSKDALDLKVLFVTHENFDQKHGKYNFIKIIEYFKPYPILHDKITKKYDEVVKMIDEGKSANQIKKAREWQVGI